MAKYKVNTTVLDRIDRTQNPVFDKNDQPRKMIRHKRGDIVEFHEDDHSRNVTELQIPIAR